MGAVFHCQKTPGTLKCPHSCKVVTEYVMNLLLLLLLQVKYTQKRKKLHGINKWIEGKKIANLHTYMAILTNIKLDYSSANSIYYCT